MNQALGVAPQEGFGFAPAWPGGFHYLASLLGLLASCRQSKFGLCAHAWPNPGL